MAFLLASERSPAAAFSPNLVRFLPEWFAQARAKRARRVTLIRLLELEDFRLDDLGLCRQDIVAAMNCSRPEVALSAARLQRARA